MILHSSLDLHGHTNWVNTVKELGSEGWIVSASKDNTARLWKLTEARCSQVFRFQEGSVNDIGILDDTHILALNGRNVHVCEVTTRRVLASSTVSRHLLWSCMVLNPNTAMIGDREGNLFKIGWDQRNITVLKQQNAHSKCIGEIYGGNEKVATCSADKTAKLWSTDSLKLLHSFKGHRDTVNSVCYDDKYLATGSNDCTIRIYNVNSARLLRTISTHEQWVRCVRIVENSKTVISGGDDEAIMMHSMASGQFLTKLDVDMTICSIALLSCGKVSVVGKPYAVKVLGIDGLQNPSKEQSGPSPLELAFSSAVESPDILTAEFIEQYIKSDHVRSAIDLFCGHNIVLLAIRCGVITPKDVRKFNGDRWFFEENLYYPASKLTSESKSILYPIFRHAEDIGIIQDGHGFRREHENRADSRAQFESMQQFIEALSIRLANVDSRLRNGLQDVDRRLGRMSISVEKNARNFHSLFTAIKKKERLMRYAAIAKVLLSIIPILGRAFGDATYIGADVIYGLTPDYIVHQGAEAAKAGAGKHFNVDLSNAQLTYWIFSQQNMRKMSQEAQTIINQAVNDSGFRTMKTLRSTLKKLIQDSSLEEKHIAMLDIGSAEWLKFDPREQAIADTYETVRHQFRAFARGKGTKDLKICDAVDALNTIFNIIHISKEVSAQEFEEVFLKTTNDLEVSENTFIEVFEKIKGEIEPVDERGLKREFAKVFQEVNRDRETVGVQYATRILQAACREMKKRGMLCDISHSDVEIEERTVATFDGGETGQLNCDEFVDAALCVVHSKKRKQRKRSSRRSDYAGRAEDRGRRDTFQQNRGRHHHDL